MSVLLPAHACARLLGSEVEEAVCRARHGIRGGSAERKMRLLPLLLPIRTVGMRFSRVQWGEDAKSKPANCRLKEEERGEIKKKKKAGQKLEGNVPPAHVSALCRLPSDATHSVHYNKAVVCSAGSVQQGDKVLPLYQKQLQRGEKVLEQEISSFEFSLSLFSFFKPDSNSKLPPLIRCRRFCTSLWYQQEFVWLSPEPMQGARVAGLLSEVTVASGFCLQGGRWCLLNNHVLHGREVLAVKVWS